MINLKDPNGPDDFVATSTSTSSTITAGEGMSYFNIPPSPAGYLVIDPMFKVPVMNAPNKFRQKMMKVMFGWEFEPYTVSCYTITTAKDVPSTPTRQLLLD